MCFTPYLKAVNGYMQLLPDGNCFQCDKKKTEQIVARVNLELRDPKYLLTDDIKSTLEPCMPNCSLNHIKLFSKYIACFMTLTLDEDNTTDTHHNSKKRKKKYYNYHPEVNQQLWSNQLAIFPNGITEPEIEQYEKQYNTNFQYWSYVLQRPQLKNFEDDVRKYVFKHPEENGKTYLCPDPHGVKFVACGEYGTKRNRPHYHIIFLGFMPLDIRKTLNRNSDSPSRFNFKSLIMDKIWDNKGFVDVAYDINDSTLRYCCKYLAKTMAVEKIKPHVTTISKDFLDLGIDVSSLLDERYLIAEYTPFLHYSNNLGMQPLKDMFRDVLTEFDLTPADLKQPNFITENDYFLLGVKQDKKAYFIYKEDFLRLPHDLKRHFVEKNSYHSFSNFYDKAQSLTLDERSEIITKNCYKNDNSYMFPASSLPTSFENSFTCDCCVSTWLDDESSYNISFQDRYDIDFKNAYREQSFLRTLCSPQNDYIRIQVEKCMYLGNDNTTKALLEKYKGTKHGYSRSAKPRFISDTIIDNILNFTDICRYSKTEELELPNVSEYQKLVHNSLYATRSFIEEKYNNIVHGSTPDKLKASPNLVSHREDKIKYCDGTEFTRRSNELEFTPAQLSMYQDLLYEYKTTKTKMLMPNPATGLLGGLHRTSSKLETITVDDKKISCSRLYNKSLPFYKIENKSLYEWLEEKGSTVINDGSIISESPMYQYVTSKRKRFYKVVPHEEYFKEHWDNIEQTLIKHLIDLERPSFDDAYTRVTPVSYSQEFIRYYTELAKRMSTSNLTKIKILLSKALLLRVLKELTKMEDGIILFQDVRDIISDYDVLKVVEKLRLYVSDNIEKYGEHSRLILLLSRVISKLTIVKNLKLRDFKGNRVRENPLLHSNLATFDDVFKFLMFYNPPSYRLYFRVTGTKYNTPRKRFEHFFNITMEDVQEVYGRDVPIDKTKIDKIIKQLKPVEVEFEELNEQINISEVI